MDYRVYALEKGHPKVTAIEILECITDGQAMLVELAIEKTLALIVPERTFEVITVKRKGIK